MSATLWLTDDDSASLGGTIQLYKAYQDMLKVAGKEFWDDWPDLGGVMSQVESQEPADPEWLADVREQAHFFLQKHEDQLEPYTVGLLGLLKEVGSANLAS